MLADFTRCGGRVHRDGQALSSCQDDLDRDMLLGLDSLGTDRWYSVVQDPRTWLQRLPIPQFSCPYGVLRASSSEDPGSGYDLAWCPMVCAAHTEQVSCRLCKCGLCSPRVQPVPHNKPHSDAIQGVESDSDNSLNHWILSTTLYR